ncbi:uncharacterized protein LOC135837334 [Planococcus citri]|uniref:uncharacterized protein LOC135837334 n=1 Tax=Planococcus citri TaxID=170843 RepID=UPI0031F79C32
MSSKTLQQVYADCVSAAKLSPSITVQKGNLYRWKGRVASSITAELKYRSLPHYGLEIVDNTASIPCIIVDPVAAVSKFLAYCDQTIIIRDPHFSVEVVLTESKQYDLVHLFLEPDTVKLPDQGPNITVAASILETTKVNDKNQGFVINIIPLKISSAILTSKNEVICLVLATVIYQDEDRKKDDVWLVLRNEQVTWKEFLISNRNYTLSLPSTECLNDFKKYKSFHMIADKYLDLPHRQMFHHKDLIKTMAVTLLPENSQISSNFTLNDEIPTEDWFSILDDRLYKLKFASVYGVIKDINYLESWNMMNCPWCDPPGQIDRPECNSTPEKPAQDAPKHQWSSLVSQFSYKTEDTIHLPRMKIDPPKSKVTGFGIRGGKINVQITLQEVSTARVTYVFLKRWKMEQYPAGLAKGVTVCFTDVNIKRSRKNNLYFVNTPLTRILHLNVFNTLKDDSGSHWGVFGFPYLDDERVWGTLELEMLAKVSITTKCKLCNEIFARFRCPNVFCANHRKNFDEATYEVTATARLFIRGPANVPANTLYLKNEHVQMYLDLPDRIWRKLCRYSAFSELVYSPYFSDLSSENTNVLIKCLSSYCKYLSKTRFHVYCKRFKGDASKERKYFCVEMKKIDPHRFAATGALLEDTSTSESEQSRTESSIEADK